MKKNRLWIIIALLSMSLYSCGIINTMNEINDVKGDIKQIQQYRKAQADKKAQAAETDSLKTNTNKNDEN